MKMKLAQAILQTEAYYKGYSKPIASDYTFYHWHTLYEQTKYTNGINKHTIFQSKFNAQKQSYVDEILQTYAKHLHDLFRYATKMVGSDAKTTKLIYHMNNKSKLDHPNCPIQGSLRLTKHHFWKFFHKNGGKLFWPTSKPRLSRKNKKNKKGEKVVEKSCNNTIPLCIHWWKMVLHHIKKIQDENLTLCWPWICRRCLWCCPKNQKLSIPLQSYVYGCHCIPCTR
jgi:hypothetical protein